MSENYNMIFDNMDVLREYMGVFGAFFGVILIFAIITFIIGIIFTICVVIGKWKAFKKAGKAGWEAIVPIYNQVVLCQISGINPWWVLIVIVGGIVLQIIPGLGAMVSFALSVYFYVILYVSAARSFGKPDGYAAGLYFLAPIFWLLVGGKNTQYVGPKPMQDVVWEFVDENFLKKNNAETKQAENASVQQTENKESENENTIDNVEQAKFCTSCGYKVVNGENFCPACGEKIQKDNEVL